MKTWESRYLLGKMLMDNKALNSINCAKAWEVYKAFSKCTFECTDDALLWQVGVYEYDKFSYDITRQFIHEKDDEYEYMEQLGFSIFFEPVNILLSLKGNCWTYEFNDSFEAFFEHVEQREDFLLPPKLFTPIGYDITFSEV